MMLNPCYRYGVLLSGVLQVAVASVGLAHTTAVSGDVAGTWHVEPNHNPRAGEPAQVWIALTQQGGTIIPLAQCDCQLTVYDTPYTEGDAPLLTPPLTAIAAERYEGIPSAEVTFPAIGQYQLELSGTPKAGATFQPFTMRHEVIVASGVTATPTPSPAIAPASPSPASIGTTMTTGDRPVDSRLWSGLGAIVLIAAGIGLWLRQSTAKSR